MGRRGKQWEGSSRGEAGQRAGLRRCCGHELRARAHEPVAARRVETQRRTRVIIEHITIVADLARGHVEHVIAAYHRRTIRVTGRGLRAVIAVLARLGLPVTALLDYTQRVAPIAIHLPTIIALLSAVQRPVTALGATAIAPIACHRVRVITILERLNDPITAELDLAP